MTKDEILRTVGLGTKQPKQPKPKIVEALEKLSEFQEKRYVPGRLKSKHIRFIHPDNYRNKPKKLGSRRDLIRAGIMNKRGERIDDDGRRQSEDRGAREKD